MEKISNIPWMKVYHNWQGFGNCIGVALEKIHQTENRSSPLVSSVVLTSSPPVLSEVLFIFSARFECSFNIFSTRFECSLFIFSTRFECSFHRPGVATKRSGQVFSTCHFWSVLLMPPKIANERTPRPPDPPHSFRVYVHIFTPRLECSFASSPLVSSVFFHQGPLRLY